MSDLLKQLELPSEHTEETLHVKRMKETLAGMPESRGDRISVVFKMRRDLHGQALAALVKHGMTMTDVLNLHIEQLLPVLQRAKAIEVPGYKRDMRTRAPRR